MSELLHSLGIEWKVLIAQIINFAILLFILKKFAVAPIMRLLEKREERILRDKKLSEEIETKIINIEKSKEEILDQARKESQKLIRETEISAAKLKEELIAQAHREAEGIMERGKKSLYGERLKAEVEMRKEIGSLLAMAVEKTVGNAMDKKTHEHLIEEAKQVLANIKRENA